MLLSKAKIGLALSGGGIRAAIFHLGVLQYMAEAGLYANISSISSVSGASMCTGLIFAANNNKWPDQDEFKKIQPLVREIILHKNIQKSALMRLTLSPAKWNNRVEILAKMLEKKWGIDGTLQDLPPYPYWEINCTTFETGGRFRFRRDYMGDNLIGYVQRPRLKISHMLAASAAFPVLIGPYELDTEGLRFTRDKQGKGSEVKPLNSYSLWDGGVYDNLGLDALYKVCGRLDEHIDFLIVSNAGASLNIETRGRPVHNLRRLLDISSAQCENLRVRDFALDVLKKKRGLYLKIGTNPENHYARNYPTTLNSPSARSFDEIFYNGYGAMEFAVGGYYL
ncbi:MAG: patatin-like phospholipase family protein [Defluviitaleaceae bacterium]|nr:patatin-like phospholipase family protein [Defluviitaleaceae bacterium]